MNEKFISLIPIKTKRLEMLPTSTKDIDLILKMDKQEITQKYLGGIKDKTYEERIAFLQKKEDKIKNRISVPLTVYLKDKTPIGFIGLKIDENNNSAELSYIFDYDFCNKGYCTEAALELIRIGFKELKLDKIVADTIEGNISSIRVLEKLGFSKINVRKNEAYIKETSEYKDFLDYCLLKENYKF